MQTDDNLVLTKQQRSFRLTPQLILGVLIIIVGTLFTLDNLGVLRADEYLRYWPAGLLAIGLTKLWQSRDGVGGTFSGVMFTVVGVWLLLDAIDIIVEARVWDLWPVLLVALGGYIVWQGMGGRRRSPGADSNAVVTAFAVMGGVARGNNSRSFRGGELTAVMGGCEIDLRQAAIEGEAVIDVFAMWGGIDIRVPEDWTVVGRVVPLLGGFEDKTRPPKQESAAQRLVVRGFAIMGGVEVKN